MPKIGEIVSQECLLFIDVLFQQADVALTNTIKQNPITFKVSVTIKSMIL